MLVVIRLDLGVSRIFLHRRCIQLDIAYAELFRRDEVVLVLLVVSINFSVANLLFRCQCVDINRRFTHHALLRHQCRQLFSFTFQHEIGAHHRVDQLLRGQLVTQCLSVLVSRHTHLVNNAVVTRVVELPIRLESLRREDGFFNLLIADAQTQAFRVLIQQRLVNKAVQRLLTQVFHIAFVGCKFRVLVAQLLLHAVTFTSKSVLELPTANFLAIHFCGVVRATADEVTTHTGQYERHDNDTENNLEHETVSSRA